MAMVTSSACNTKLSKTLSLEDNHNNLRTASFSSYLNGTDESFVLKLAESNQNLSPITTIQQEHLYMGKKATEGGEIGVFGAERYFNGGMEEETPRIANKCVRTFQFKSDEPADLESMKPKNQPATPSVRSDSSWNSHSALLQSVLRNPPRSSKPNKVHGKSFLASLGCRCYCSDKDSVDIDEYAGGNNFNRTASCGAVHGKAITNEPIKTGLNPVDVVQTIKPRLESWDKEEMHCQKIDKFGVMLNREKCFPSPIINSGAGNLPVKLHIQEKEAEKPRKSLEVFGSPILDKKNKPMSLERRLTMLSWDATPGADEIDIPPASGGIYNDTESDASSDLFEIESLTGKANPFLTRQVSDGTPGCITPTTGYAPSEASIEWSVVTASVADFSVVSDYEERRPATMITSPSKKIVANTTAKATTNKDMPRRRPGILLGCTSHKAVRVAGEAYRTNEKAILDPRMHHRLDSFTPVTRFQAEAKLIGFDSRNGQHAFATRLLPRSEPARASPLLYIQ